MAGLDAAPLPFEAGRDRRQAVLASAVASLIAGTALILAAVSVLAYVSLREPGAGAALGTAMLMELFTGREATVPVALAGGAPPWAVAFVSITQNLGIAALVSPLILGLFKRWHGRTHFLARRLRRLHAAAQSRRTWVEQWGPLGLFVFMLAPLIANGAAIAVFVGRMVGLVGWRLWLAVTSGVVVTATAWTYAYHWLLRAAANLDQQLPFLLSGAMAAVAVAAAFVDEMKERRSGARQ